MARCVTCWYTSRNVEHSFYWRRRRWWWKRKCRRRWKEGLQYSQRKFFQVTFLVLTATMNMMPAVIRNVTPCRLLGVPTFRSILLPTLSTFMGVPLSAARPQYWQLSSRWSKAQEVHAVHPDEGSTNFQNDGNYSPNNTELHPRRLESSAKPLWAPTISQVSNSDNLTYTGGNNTETQA